MGESAGFLRRGLVLGGTILCGVLAGCAGQEPIEPRPASSGHVSTAPAGAPPGIPAPVTRAPILLPPQPSAPTETYTVVVNEVPVKELLFALSRDASINVDVHPKIDGLITMNAIDQSLQQILERIARQVAVRYEYRGGTLVVEPDAPFLRTYKIEYVNLSRDTENNVAVSTQISNASISESGGGGAGGASSDENNSTTEIKTTSNNRFWETLREAILAILQEPGTDKIDSEEGKSNPFVIMHPETGVIAVRATSVQHQSVQGYLDDVLASARRQVLIQATIVEVQLNDRYRSGIDFTRVLTGGGAVTQSVLSGNLGTAPFFLLQLANDDGDEQDTALTVRLLKEFGDVRVLSTPTVMALNNQTAIFKVVENRVFFTVEADTVPGVLGSQPIANFDTTPHTVPVGLVMTVTPQVGSDDEITLNVRPTITRTLGRGVQDPNPALINAGAVSLVPEIAVREIESVLRLRSGQIAVLGGLMQDEVNVNTGGTPVLGDIPGLGELFKFRDNNYTKSELVIFLKPTVVRTASVESDLRAYRQYLPENVEPGRPLPAWSNPGASGGGPRQ